MIEKFLSLSIRAGQHLKVMRSERSLHSLDSFDRRGKDLRISPRISGEVTIGDYKRDAWNSRAASERYLENVERTFFGGITSEIFMGYLGPEDRVLDIGAGTGRLSFPIADKGCEVVAVDISESMLRALEENKGERRITSILSDGDKIPVEDAQFDAVVSMDFMFHFPNWRDFLREQVRVCKSGGHIIYNFYASENLKNIDTDATVAGNCLAGGEFIAQCTKQELEETCDALGLEIVRLHPYDFLAVNGLWFPNLSMEEASTFLSLYRKILANETILSTITKFEHDIVGNLSPEDCARMIVVLRKKGEAPSTGDQEVDSNSELGMLHGKDLS